MAKFLGIDYGEKNIGIALSDDSGQQAFVYDTMHPSVTFWDDLNNIIKKENIYTVVVGLPLGLNGEYTDKTNEVITFIHLLETKTKAIVETEDERFSTKEALGQTSNNGRDEASAQIILQRFLDKNNN